MLVDRDEYMENGVHIGMRRKIADMEPFIYFTKRNRLSVIDLEKTDERIQRAAELLAQYDPNDIFVVSHKDVGRKPAEEFARSIGAAHRAGRFMPGTLTNPNADNFMEPRILLVTDPLEDRQAIDEAKNANIPVIGICDTANYTENIDLVIPANNKGKNALALVFYLLTQQFLEEVEEEGDFDLDDFVTPDVEE